jgi:DNA polymerase-3 subunit alpha
MDTKDKVPFFVNQTEQMGIEILPPDVNLSDHEFVVVEGNIRFGLDAVKNVGSAAVDAIIAAREKDGPLTSIWDFCERVDCSRVNKKAIESLVKCGAFDSTGDTRAGMLEVLPQAQATGNKVQQDAQLGQGSIFDFGAEAGGGAAPSQASQHRPPISAAEFDRAELLAMEKETLGTYLSSHPLTEVGPALRAKVDCSLSELDRKPDGAWVTVGGIVVECKKIRTKSGSQMMFATLDDVEGQIEMLVFKADEAESAQIIAPDAIVIVRGRIDHKDRGETKLVVQEAQRFEPDAAEVERAAKNAPAITPGGPQRATTGGPFQFSLPAEKALDPHVVEELKTLFEDHKGESDVHLVVETSSGTKKLCFGAKYKVQPSPNLRYEIGQLLGSDAVAA